MIEVAGPAAVFAGWFPPVWVGFQPSGEDVDEFVEGESVEDFVCDAGEVGVDAFVGEGFGGECFGVVFHAPIMGVGYSDVNTLPTKYEARQIEQQAG